METSTMGRKKSRDFSENDVSSIAVGINNEKE